MLRTPARISPFLLPLLLVTCLVAGPGAGARAQESPPPSSAALSNPRAAHEPGNALKLTDPGELELARHSLAGPRAEVITGAVVLAGTPLLAGMVMLAAGPNWFECGGLFGEEQSDPQCEARVARQEEHAARMAIGVGLTFGLIGTALVTHGAYRIRQIRVARREVSLRGASLALDRGYAGLTFRASF